MSSKIVDQPDCTSSFPEGRSQVSGYRLIGSVSSSNGDVMGEPREGKNSYVGLFWNAEYHDMRR